MPVALGILCERCRTVYFISPCNNKRIRYDRVRGDFKLTCDPPCKAANYFHKTMLKPYSVSKEALERGCTDVRECRAMSAE